MVFRNFIKNTCIYYSHNFKIYTAQLHAIFVSCSVRNIWIHLHFTKSKSDAHLSFSANPIYPEAVLFVSGLSE